MKNQDHAMQEKPKFDAMTHTSVSTAATSSHIAATFWLKHQKMLFAAKLARCCLLGGLTAKYVLTAKTPLFLVPHKVLKTFQLFSTSINEYFSQILVNFPSKGRMIRNTQYLSHERFVCQSNHLASAHLVTHILHCGH